MKKTTKILFVAIVTATLISCNNSGNKENVTNADTTQVKPVAKADTIEVYRYQGSDAIINTAYLSTCPESEKAILAYCSYLFGTACSDSKHCKLTEALGLAEQNSVEHKKLVNKWFNDAETVDLVMKGGNAVSSDKEAMAFFEKIRLVKDGSATLKVVYISDWIAGDKHGKGQGTDTYEIEENHIKVIARDYLDLDVQ